MSKISTAREENPFAEALKTKDGFKKVADELASYTGITGGLQVENWNDKIFENNHLLQYYPKKRSTLSEAATAGGIFLDWYINGKTPEKPTSIILNLWGAMKAPSLGGNFFPDSVFNSTSDQIIEMKDNAVTTLKFDNYQPLIPFHTSSTDADKESIRVNNTSTLRFPIPSSFTKSMVESWGADLMKQLEKEEKQQDAVIYLGYLAMIMMRCMVKNDTQNSIVFLSSASEKVVKFWPKLSIPSRTPPPTLDCIKSMKESCGRLTANGNLLMIALLEAYRNKVEHTIEGALKAACLLSLQFIGLGCLSHLTKAAVKLNVSPSYLLLYFGTHSNRLAIAELMLALKNYGNSPDEITWMWCRMIREEALSHLRVGAHLELTATLAAISLSPDNEIWGSSPYNQADKDFVYAYADAIKECIKLADSSKTITDEAGVTHVSLKHRITHKLQPEVPDPEEGYTIN